MNAEAGATAPLRIELQEHVFSIFALVLLLFLFLLPVSLENKTLINSSDIYNAHPWDQARPPDAPQMLGLDPSPLLFFQPSDLLARQLFRHGKTFVWNPYVGFGAPWVGSMQAAPYFPLKVLEWILPFWEGANLVRISLLFAAGLGCYLLAVSFGLDQGAALVAAAGYMLCERFFVFINMSNFQVEALLPLMLLALHRMFLFGSVRYAVFAGWIGATQFLGGFPESSFIFGVLSGSFFLFLIANPSIKSQWRRYARLGGIVLAITLLISGFQLGEFVRYFKYAHYSHTHNAGLVVHAPSDAIHLLLPYYLGFPLQPQNHYWTPTGSFDHMRMTLFCGLTTVILAIVSLFRQRNGRNFFFACTVIILGYDFGFPLLKQLGHLPLFDLSSIVWNAWVVPFGLSMLAAYGMHEILNGRRLFWKVSLAAIICAVLTLLCTFAYPKPTAEAYRYVLGPEIKRSLFVVGGILVALYWQRHQRYRWSTPWLILIVLSIELYNVDMKAGFLRPKVYAENPPSLSWFLKHSKGERILGLQGIYPADILLPNRVRDVRHMDAMYPKLFVNYVASIWPGAETSVFEVANGSWREYDSQLLDIAAVRYVFSPTPLSSETGIIDTILDHSAITTFDKRLVNTGSNFQIDGSSRKVLFEHPPSTVDYSVLIPADGRLAFSIGENPAAWTLPGQGTTFKIAVGDTVNTAVVKYERFYDPKHVPADRKWVEGSADLSAYAGKSVHLFLITEPGRDGKGSNASAWDGWARLRWGQDKFVPIYSDASASIYRNTEAVERARFVPFERPASPTFNPGNMKDPGFDFRQQVYLWDYKQKGYGNCPAGKQASAPVSTLQDDPDLTRFSTTAPCDGFFVLADLYYRGWKATIDGKPARIYNANYAFRAVQLPAGRHEIVFTYAPWTVSVGMPAALLTAIGSGLFLFFGKRRGGSSDGLACPDGHLPTTEMVDA